MLTVRPGTPTAIGSLPHLVASDAAQLALAHHVELPAAPQLPRRSPLEGMLGQVVGGVPGVSVQDDGSLLVTDADAACDLARVDGVSALSAERWAGLLAFLDVVAGRAEPVKLHLTGPVTTGLALLRGGLGREHAFAVGAAAVVSTSRALVAAARARVPEAGLVVFFDEPGLTTCGHPGFPLPPPAVVDLVSAALASVGNGVATGVHCCGPTDWRMVTDAGPDVLSLPLALVGYLDPGVAAAYLERGGWIAWGAIPTDGPIGENADLFWRRLMTEWSAFTRAGCDPELLRSQSLITPACGLANHGLSQADRVLALTARLAERVRDPAVATRLSMGA
jgi:hypothetical protein